LGVAASSATTERIFSASGRVLEERRQHLNSDVVNDILFCETFEICDNFVYYYCLKLIKYAETL
jgi:hypothetical protein